MKRKKRLEKGINSIDEQIKVHKQKREKALEEGDAELAEYYAHEIDNLGKTKARKQEQIDKQ